MNQDLNEKKISKLVSDVVPMIPNLIKNHNITLGDGWEGRLIAALKKGSAAEGLISAVIELVVDSEQWKEATKNIFDKIQNP